MCLLQSLSRTLRVEGGQNKRFQLSLAESLWMQNILGPVFAQMMHCHEKSAQPVK